MGEDESVKTFREKERLGERLQRWRERERG